MTTPDPLLERLRRLPRPALDDVAAARTLARAETAFAAPQVDTRPRRARMWVPAALALWGALYAFGAVRELGRLYAASPEKPAVAINHRGPAGLTRGEPPSFARRVPSRGVRDPLRVPSPINGQFMLNAISNASARTTTTTTIVPPLPDTLRATSRSNAVPVCSDVSSDMDPSMQVVACDTRTRKNVQARGGPRHVRGADGGATGARATSAARASSDGSDFATKRSVSAWGGSFQKPGRAPDSRAARSCGTAC